MWSEDQLNEMLSFPSPSLVGDMEKIHGDLMILGAGGKMGPTLSVLAQRARKASGTPGRVIAVSRFSDPEVAGYLRANGVDLITLDLLSDEAMDVLPDVPHIIYMAGRKFGTKGSEAQTWAMNAALPAFVSRRFRKSRIVVFSSGNIYPLISQMDGGCTEDCSPAPIGEYAMSCLARERVFEHASRADGCPVLLYRLNYAVDLRYGILHDLAVKILNGEPISLRTSAFNCVWQGYANEVAIRCLQLAASPAAILNVTGPETISVSFASDLLGQYLGRKPVFIDDPTGYAYLSQAGRCFEQYGYPSVTLNEMIRWQAEWLLSGGRSLDKPTHFEEQEGQF